MAQGIFPFKYEFKKKHNRDNSLGRFASISEFGLVNVIIIDSGGVLGMKYESVSVPISSFFGIGGSEGCFIKAMSF